MSSEKNQTKYIPRLKSAFGSAGVKILQERLGKENINAVPKLQKIVLNIGVSAARENIKALDIANDELAQITGQKPSVRKSKNSISAFKLREGMPIGVCVTLRGARMYEFLDRFISIAVPRIRDFRGLSPTAFDGGGNYNLGIKEQYIFPEVNVEKSDAPRGMNITFVTSANTDKEAFELLHVLGLPFAKKEKTLQQKVQEN
ncbi:MAG: 50S ribosomal protein L5 [Elusimicrobia bacterium]|nr:50S ribosomal protein L5 [Elusimicrobiota bacterium]